jgi:hypothetical protein
LLIYQPSDVSSALLNTSVSTFVFSERYTDYGGACPPTLTFTEFLTVEIGDWTFYPSPTAQLISIATDDDDYFITYSFPSLTLSSEATMCSQITFICPHSAIADVVVRKLAR